MRAVIAALCAQVTRLRPMNHVKLFGHSVPRVEPDLGVRSPTLTQVSAGPGHLT
jgi:hypothetical protein